MWLFCYFNFERNYDVLKSKSAGILLNKNINFNKKETESKTENHTYTVLERRTFYGAISNPDVPCSKPLGGSKVDSPFHLSEFNKRSISFFIKFFFFFKYKNHKLKPRWVGAHASKKRGFFVLFILSEGNIFHICVSCQCIVYWIPLQNIQFFTYQKTILHALFCLFLKSGKAFSVSLILIADFSANKLFYVGFFESTFSV